MGGWPGPRPTSRARGAWERGTGLTQSLPAPLSEGRVHLEGRGLGVRLESAHAHAYSGECAQGGPRRGPRPEGRPSGERSGTSRRFHRQPPNQARLAHSAVEEGPS